MSYWFIQLLLQRWPWFPYIMSNCINPTVTWSAFEHPLVIRGRQMGFKWKHLLFSIKKSLLLSRDLYLFNYSTLIESSDEALLIHFRPCDLLCLVSFMKKSFSMRSRRISIWTASFLVGWEGSLPLALILEKILQAEIIDSQLARRLKYCLHGRT